MLKNRETGYAVRLPKVPNIALLALWMKITYLDRDMKIRIGTEKQLFFHNRYNS